MHTYINNNLSIASRYLKTNIKVSYLIPILMALLCLAITPMLATSLYAKHAVIVSRVVIAYAVLCQICSIGRRGLVFGLLIISMVEMVTYRMTIYKMADLFLIRFPKEFHTVRANQYQPLREKKAVSNFFSFKPLDIYGIGSSYLQEDFCPAPRQDLVSAGVKTLFDLRQSKRPVSMDPREALDPKGDEILAQTLGCGTLKLRMVSQVHYAKNNDEASRLIATSDIYSKPIITMSSPPPVNAQSYDDYTIKEHYFSANRLELTVNNKSENPMWLIYADAFNPRWAVTVDGKPQRVYQANIAFKAVAIDRGEHEVSFIFSRPAFGFILFGCMMILLACLVLAAIGIMLKDNSRVSQKKD